MDVYEKLEELQEKALHDETMKQALLATRTEKEPIIAFCKKCQEFGYEIYRNPCVVGIGILVCIFANS